MDTGEMKHLLHHNRQLAKAKLRINAALPRGAVPSETTLHLGCPNCHSHCPAFSTQDRRGRKASQPFYAHSVVSGLELCKRCTVHFLHGFFKLCLNASLHSPEGSSTWKVT